MKNFARYSIAALFLGSLFGTALPVRAADPDFALINKLPERETAAKKAAHTGWDTNAPARMLAATGGYNDALTAMISDLATTYYGKAKVTKEDVSAYVKTLKSAAEFRHRLDNPTNEPLDSLDTLEVPSVVSNDLEDTVEQMVEAVTGESEHFDYAAWEKRWVEARKAGDIPEKEAATAAIPEATAIPAATPPEPRKAN